MLLVSCIVHEGLVATNNQTQNIFSKPTPPRLQSRNFAALWPVPVGREFSQAFYIPPPGVLPERTPRPP